MDVCQMTQQEFMFTGGIAIMVMGLIPILLPKPVTSFYIKFYALMGRHVDSDSIFWHPMAVRLYGLITIIFGLILIKG